MYNKTFQHIFILDIAYSSLIEIYKCSCMFFFIGIFHMIVITDGMHVQKLWSLLLMKINWKIYLENVKDVFTCRLGIWFMIYQCIMLILLLLWSVLLPQQICYHGNHCINCHSPCSWPLSQHFRKCKPMGRTAHQHTSLIRPGMCQITAPGNPSMCL